MRKRMLFIAVAAMLAAVATSPLGAVAIQQEPPQQTKDIAGNLQSVDLEESTIVVKQEDDTEITLVVTDTTVVRDPYGETTTLAALSGKEGQALTARFVAIQDDNIALTIQLVA